MASVQLSRREEQIVLDPQGALLFKKKKKKLAHEVGTYQIEVCTEKDLQFFCFKIVAGVDKQNRLNPLSDLFSFLPSEQKGRCCLSQALH